MESGAVDSLGIYLEQLPRRPRLTRAEEQRLVGVAQSGRAAQCILRNRSGDARLIHRVQKGKEAEATLAECFLPAVIHAAKVLHFKNRRHVALEDLISAGHLGLTLALERYERSRGTRFWTYAVWWVRQQMRQQIRFSRWFMGIPDREYRAVVRRMRAFSRLHQYLGRPPSPKELAERLTCSLEDLNYIEYRLSLNNVLSLDRPVGQDGKSTLGDFIVGTQAPMGGEEASASLEESDLLRNQLRGDIQNVLHEHLTERERLVLASRFGLGGAEKGTLQQIGQQLQVTGERVRQIEAGALSKLRRRLKRAEYGDVY